MQWNECWGGRDQLGKERKEGNFGDINEGVNVLNLNNETPNVDRGEGAHLG